MLPIERWTTCSKGRLDHIVSNQVRIAIQQIPFIIITNCIQSRSITNCGNPSRNTSNARRVVPIDWNYCTIIGTSFIGNPIIIGGVATKVIKLQPSKSLNSPRNSSCVLELSSTRSFPDSLIVWSVEAVITPLQLPWPKGYGISSSD